MSASYLELTYLQVGIAASLIVINGIISIALKLGLGRRLLIASVRMTAQLLLIGFVLQWIFAINQVLVVLALISLMTLIAGFSAVDRTAYRFPGLKASSIISVWASSWLVAGIAVLAIIQVEPWYRPQYLIPLIGMILGNTLNGISLGLDRFATILATRRSEIDARLALGATSWEAASEAVRESVRTGMIPILNVMMVSGIVSLPGMMTGQLLSGVAPIQAVKYQIVIMFLIAAGAALGTVGSVLLSFRRLFNERHQFLFHKIEEAKKSPGRN